MQPELSPSSQGREQGPVQPGYSYEIPPNYASPEVGPASSPERFPAATPERAPERSPVELAPPPPAAAPVIQPPSVALPTVQPAPDPTSAQNPASANDDDVIEKEWVDRARQVIVQTRNDPRGREKAIGALQRDYLMKRYGKQLGETAD